MLTTRLSIIGVGLLGGSIGLAVKAGGLNYSLVGYGHRRSTLDRAREIGAIDEIAGSITEAVKNADLVILCTPVGLLGQNLADIAPALKAGCIVTDVGSTKRSVVRDAGRLLPDTVHFVGSHPMAGSDRRGIEFARADLFRSATCIVTPTTKTDRDALQTVEKFWQSLGMQTTALSPDEHDKRISDVSHLPHLLAAALVAMQRDETLKLAGPGFLDATRIAGGDGGLWRDILQDNHDSVNDSLKRLERTLHDVMKLMDPSRSDELSRWLDEAAARRAALAQQKVRDFQ